MTDRARSSLSLQTKLAYGIGEWSGEVPGSLLVYFVLFFLTNAAGMSPGMAATVLVAGKVWDALNDPIIGWLSDRTRSARWGRRYPWMLLGMLPLGASFVLQWWVPPGLNERGLWYYYAAVGAVYFLAFTAVRLPYSTLLAELTHGYDERTSLASFKAGFSIAGSILTLAVAQAVLATDAPLQQQFAALGAICAVVAVASVVVCVAGTYRRYWTVQAGRGGMVEPEAAQAWSVAAIWGQMGQALACKPFRFAIGIYLCSWVSLQLTASVLPYFTVSWMGLDESRGVLMLLIVQGTAMVAIAVWGRLGRRLGKRAIYCWGIPLTIVGQLGMLFLAPGQEGAMYALGALAGVGLATAYLVPWSLLPDVIDADELTTGQRREGIFYSLIVQLQKFGAATTIFCVGILLDWSGFVASTAEAVVPQPPLALLTIRVLVALVPALILLAGIFIATFYPITREVHGEIVLKLHAQRQAQMASRQ